MRHWLSAMPGTQLRTLRRTDVAGILVFALLVAVLAGSLAGAWPSGSLANASTSRKIAVAVSAAALLVTLLLGLVGIGTLRERRRVVALAGILRDRECRACGAAYDPAAVDRSAHLVEPLCGGEPEKEDLRPRWMVQCGSWAGFGDDSEPIEGGVVPVPQP
jgi:hypothetical protein